MGRHDTTSPRDVQGMTPRAFAGILGAVAIIVAIAFLATPMTPDGTYTSCGSAISPTEQVGVNPTVLCEEAVDDRRAWAIPVGIAGLVVAAGAAVIRVRPTGAASDPAPQP